MSSSVEQIKSKVDIVSLISSYIQLEKAGSNFKGKCPFHNEKTPSFFVSPDRGNYYCFGCLAKGDIFTFVQEFEGLDFIGALKVLAEKAGVTLDSYDRGDKTESERLHTVMEKAQFFFEKKLSENKPAMDYVLSRGISEKTIKDFHIGFIPNDWRQLYEFLLSKSVTAQDMLAVGLIKQKEGNKDSFYDVFRGRIMFPINDSSGRVVAFSGRILVADDKSPKYLNSPETTLFVKSEILFGLDKAKKDIRLRDYSILVEGQMDLVMLHQVGVTNTVASSGTALTSEHLIKLRRLSNRIIMAFDGDPAGFSASDRSSKLALSLGMELKIAGMPEGKDPADMAKENPEELRNILKHSKHIIDFYVEHLLSQKIDGLELGKKIKDNVLPYVAVLPSSIEKAHFIKNISQKTFIKEDALWEDLKYVANPDVPAYVEKTPVDRLSRIDSIEKKLLGLILWQKSLQKPEIVVSKVEEKFLEITGDRGAEMLRVGNDDLALLLFETEAYYNGTNNVPRDAEELLVGLEEEYLKKKFTETMSLLHKAEQSRDSSLILKYLEDCQAISQKINIIKQIKNRGEGKG